MEVEVEVEVGCRQEQFVIYAQRLINLIFLCVNLHHEPLSCIRGELSDGKENETRERETERTGGRGKGKGKGEGTTPKLFGPHQTPATMMLMSETGRIML